MYVCMYVCALTLVTCVCDMLRLQPEVEEVAVEDGEKKKKKKKKDKA